MSTPTPGKNYTVQSGDSLSSISARAYGNLDHWPTIWASNLNVLQGDDPNVINPGDVFFIPVLGDFRTTPKLASKSPDNLTLIIGSKEIPVTAARVIRTIDTAADGWTATIPWNPGEDVPVQPYQYKDAFVFLGGQQVVSGVHYGVAPQVNAQGRSLNLAGNSYTADAVDSTMRPPYEYSDITLEDLANELVKPFGIKAIFDDESGGKFDRVTADPMETVFDFLAKLAFQRGLLISSDIDGNMLFLKANTSSKPVATIEEGPDTFGAQGATEYQADYDGRKLYSSYKAIGQTPGGTSNEAVSKDKNVNRPRFLTFKADDLIDGEMQNAADWERSKRLAKALTIPFPVSSWYDPSGNLWMENTLVTVKSETIFAPDGFTFLIRQVEYIFEGGGIRAILSLVPPQVYTGEELEVPWG